MPNSFGGKCAERKERNERHHHQIHAQVPKADFRLCFYSGRDESGRRLQKVKCGFASKKEAEEALRIALEAAGKSPGSAEQAIEEHANRRVTSQTTLHRHA
jgi:hypothetical protein